MIQRLEQLSMKINPCIKTLSYDGWVIRFANGFNREANSINPLYSSSYYSLERKITHCESLFRLRKLPVVFKITNSSGNRVLDSTLNSRNYVLLPGAKVCLLNLDNIEKSECKDITVFSTPTSLWIKCFLKFTETDIKYSSLLKDLYKEFIPSAIFSLLIIDGNPIGCCLGIIENKYLGLFNLCIDKNFRGKGYGKQLLSNVLNEGKKRGAKYSYLQVSLDNVAACNLYKNLGFTDQYKYWYRAKI